MIKTTATIVKNIPKSSSLQWALIGTTILKTLIAGEDTLTMILGEEWSKGLILLFSVFNGVMVALYRNNRTKPFKDI